MKSPDIVAWCIAYNGKFRIDKRGDKLYPRIELESKDLDFITHFEMLAECGVVVPAGCFGKYKWSIRKTNELYDFCVQIVPHMPAKSKQAEMMISLCKSHRGSTSYVEVNHNNLVVYKMMKMLNK